jgi:hypothetical protein
MTARRPKGRRPPRAITFSSNRVRRHRKPVRIDSLCVKGADMNRRIRSAINAVSISAALACACGAGAQTTAAPQTGSAAATPDNAVLLTVFLKHDQSRPLGEINAQLRKQGFYQAFPPAGMEVVSWYVAMGIGQIITLRLPASRVREVNRVLEDTAWGSYRTEFYLSYDYKAIGLDEHAKAK